MTMTTRGCWIVVVDTQGAMILENAGTVAKPDLRLIDRVETPRIDATPEVTAHERSDRGHLAQTAMVAMLITRLSFAVRQSRTARLAIAAPADLLGAIRLRLTDDLRARVVLMLPRNLSDQPLEKVVTVMQDAMERAA